MHVRDSISFLHIQQCIVFVSHNLIIFAFKELHILLPAKIIFTNYIRNLSITLKAYLPGVTVTIITSLYISCILLLFSNTSPSTFDRHWTKFWPGVSKVLVKFDSTGPW